MSSNLTEYTNAIIEKVLLDPKNMATPAELTQQAKACLRALDRADTDQNNIITYEEISTLCEIMGLPVHSDGEDSLLEMDIDKSGTLENMEFLEWWLRRISAQPGHEKQQEVMARNTFLTFDVDNSGAITAEEFGSLVAALGVEFTEQECDDAIAELDTDGSGVIECNEFIAWWVNRTKSVRKGGGLIAFKLKKLANKAAQMFHTDIHTAAWKGQLDLVIMFLDAESRIINAPDTSDEGNGWTPLHYACYKGHGEIVDELIRRSANVNKTNDDGFSPLFYAAQQNHVTICDTLLRAGADPSIQGRDPNYPEAPAMCPVDHIVDSDELRVLFGSHEKCTKPSDDMIYENVKLAVDGELTFEVPDLPEMSALPIRSWMLEFFPGADGGGRKCAETVINSFHSNTSASNRRGHVSCKPAASLLKTIVLVADTSGPITVEIQAVNAIGSSAPSEAVPIDMSDIFSGL